MQDDEHYEREGRYGKCPDCGRRCAALADEHLECGCGWSEHNEDDDEKGDSDDEQM